MNKSDYKKTSSLIVVGAGFYQKPVVQAALKKGLYVIAIDRDKNAPGAFLADHHITCSAHDHAAALSEVQRILPRIPKPAGVLSAGARGCIHTTAVLAKKFQLPGIDPAVAKILSEKHLLRAELAAKGLNTFKYRLAENIEQAYDFFSDLPLVLKPSHTSGGEGIALIKNRPEIKNKWPHHHKSRSAKPILLEQFCPGADVTVVAIARKNNITVTGILDRKYQPTDPFGQPGIYTIPSSLNNKRIRETIAFAEEAFRKLGISTGPCSIELRIPEIGPVQTIEAEANVPGSFIADYLIPISTAKDFISACIDSVTDKPFPSEWPARKTASINLPELKELANAGRRR